MTFLPDWPISIAPLTVFGLMLVAGSIGGYVAHRLSWLPSITGFMFIGFLCGPSALGVLSPETIAGSRIIIDIALALILYRLGLSLDIKIIARSPNLLFISLVESMVTFGLVTYVLSLFSVPWAVAALVAAITVSSSPAVLLHVAHEIGAKGPITETAKTLVALNNLISFILFSAVLPSLHFFGGAGWTTTLFHAPYQLFGSLLLGLVIAHILHGIVLRTQKAPQYRLALVIGAIMLSIGLAEALKLSTLLVPLIVGIIVKSLEREAVVSDLGFGSSFELFFIVLFVFAGAGLHLEELVEFAPAVLAVVLTRSLAKILGVTGMFAFMKMPFRAGLSGSFMLLPMAGLAIGLVQTSKDLFPDHATSIAAIVLAAVTVFETIGPPITSFAFRFAGEANKVDEKGEEEPSQPVTEESVPDASNKVRAE